MKEPTYYYFAYGSNNLEQLAYRVGRTSEFKHEPGVMKHHTLIFAGYSERWNGGIASFHPMRGRTLRGTVVELTIKELEKLDAYEGGYRRIRKRIHLPSRPESHIYAFVYLKENHAFYSMPSSAYLNAIHNNIRKNEITIYAIEPGTKNVKKRGIWRKNVGIVEH